MSELTKKNRAILYTINRNYDFLLGVCLVNLTKTNQNYDAVIVYHDCFTEEEISKFKLIEPKVEFRFYSLEDFYSENNINPVPQNEDYIKRYSHFTPVRVAKALALLEEYKSVLYLDPDTLIVDNIDDIFELDGIAFKTGGGVNKFTNYTHQFMDNFPQKYPNFLENIDKSLETYIGHPNAGILYFNESLPYKEMILECKKWLNLNWERESKKPPNVFTFDEMMLPYLLLRFNIKPHEISNDYNVPMDLQAFRNPSPKILHNISRRYCKIWKDKNLLLSFPQWQDYYQESVKITGVANKDVVSLKPFEREYIIIDAKLKQFWIDVLKIFNLPPELKIRSDFKQQWFHLNYNNTIYYELKFDYRWWQLEYLLYPQLVITNNEPTIAQKLQELQQQIPEIIEEVAKGTWTIVKAKTVSNNRDIQRIFDIFFQKTFPIIQEYERAKFINNKYSFVLDQNARDKLIAARVTFNDELLNKQLYFNGQSCFYSSHFYANQIYQNGAFSYSKNTHYLDFRCGNYSSFAAGLQYNSDNEEFINPISDFNSMVNNKYPENINVYSKSKMRIGNEVRIGENVLLKSNIKIGTGAIIKANSNVIEDVPAYAIVEGNPAKIIKYRFEDKIIEQLLETRWTEYDISPIKMKDDISALEFIDLFYEYKDKGLLQTIRLKNFKEVLDRLEIAYSIIN